VLDATTPIDELAAAIRARVQQELI
jgi:hypothetical protein